MPSPQTGMKVMQDGEQQLPGGVSGRKLVPSHCSATWRNPSPQDTALALEALTSISAPAKMLTGPTCHFALTFLMPLAPILMRCSALAQGRASYARATFRLRSGKVLRLKTSEPWSGLAARREQQSRAARG